LYPGAGGAREDLQQTLMKETAMRRLLPLLPIAAALCVFAPSGGSVSAQPSDEIRQAFLQDMQWSGDEMRLLSESISPIFDDMLKNMQSKLMAAAMERMKDTSSPPTQEEMLKLSNDIVMDGFIGMQKPLNEKATELLSEDGRQKIHKRLFQIKTSLMERLETSDNPEAAKLASGFDMMQLMGGYPDFLELSPEQRELLIQQQKETSSKTMMLVAQEARRQAEAEQKAEPEDVVKAVAPEMKKLLIKGHEDFMRVLTDAQKAKIKAVMAETPDYIKSLLAEVDKGGDMSNVLNSWVPGMGVPGTNPNREAPRQRTNTGGGRAFGE